MGSCSSIVTGEYSLFATVKPQQNITKVRQRHRTLFGLFGLSGLFG
jgi:hypothetical protein